MVVGTSAEYAAMYPRQGFEHYFLMSPVIFGYIALVLAVGCILHLFSQRKIPSEALMFVLMIVGIYAGQHVVFNTKILDIGPSTGGNLRYFNVIAPLVSLLAVTGFEKIVTDKNAKWLKPILMIFTFITIYFTAYEHNNVGYTANQRNWIVGLPIGLLIGSFFLKLDTKAYVYGLLGLLVMQMVFMIKPLKISSEDQLAKDTAQYVIKNSNNITPKVASSHATCNYYLYDHAQMSGYSIEAFKNMRSGDWIIWDSHYSARNKVEYQTLLDDKDNFTFVKQDITPDKRFATILIQKK